MTKFIIPSNTRVEVIKYLESYRCTFRKRWNLRGQKRLYLILPRGGSIVTGPDSKAGRIHIDGKSRGSVSFTSLRKREAIQVSVNIPRAHAA